MILDGATSVQSDHTILVVVYIQEIKPWPPSHSLRSLPSVFLQWRYSDGSSGHTRHIVPTIGSGVGDGKIKFSESFKASLTESHDRYLEFSLYEPKKDNKTKQGQLVGTVGIDLVKYGDFNKSVSINAPMSFKRGLRVTAQSVLLIKIHPVNKHSSHSLSKCISSKGLSLEKDGVELANKEYLVETEISSFSHGEVATHPNLALASSSFDQPPVEGASEVVTDEIGSGITFLHHKPQPSKPELKQTIVDCININECEVFSSSLSSESSASRDEYIPFSSNHEEIEISHITISETSSFPSSPISISLQVAEADAVPNNRRRSLDRADLVRQLHEKIVKGRNRYKETAQQLAKGIRNNTNFIVDKVGSWSETKFQEGQKTSVTRLVGSDVIDDEESKAQVQGITWWNNDGRSSIVETSPTDCKDGVKPQENGLEVEEELVYLKSAQSVLDSAKGNGSIRNTICSENIKEFDALVVSRTEELKTGCSEGKVKQLECRIEKLERELREAATAEVSLYSIIAEHGSSKNMLYAPARRLSRSYFHACNYGAPAMRATAAKSTLSGLVLVVKACANDVPRLTFWLSNIVALRASISKADEKSQQNIQSIRRTKVNGFQKSKDKRPSPLKKLSFPRHKDNLLRLNDYRHDWDDPKTFINALERIEGSIFSQIIELVWLQAFTPHMQPVAESTNMPNKVSRKTQDYKRNPSLVDQKPANFSLELWKKAFKDAYEKLCPVRFGGHDCACVPVFTKSILQQCVHRLDVALFNALVCDSVNAIPASLESYQVHNYKVLPVPARISSFGTGVQLKNVARNWSGSLSDLFDTSGNKLKADVEMYQSEGSFEFQLLDALSDLMMLPKDTLLTKSFRKEVCPTFSVPLIKRILNNFVPDEFCPDKIPDAIFAALDSENAEDNKDCIQSIPCIATPMKYTPPSVTLLRSLLQYENEPRGNQSSLFRKSYTSDDELEEVNSPLSSIIFEDFLVSSARWKPKENGVGCSVRHQLLREVWRDVDL